MPKISKFNKASLIIIITIFLLLFISLSTKFYGNIDIGDYADTAKFFAGDFQAKLRTSHSLLYGITHAPFVKLTSNLIFFKLSSVLWLSLIILSIYYMSKKNKKTLLLFIASPILWYMAPWINPVQLSSLLFLWAYWFISKYDKTKSIKYLVYSGILAGLSIIFWEAVLYFTAILAICFMFDKKLSHSLWFILALFLGVLPKLIFDQIFFGFFLYSTLKHFFSVVSSILYGGIYNSQGSATFQILSWILVLIIVPFFSYILFTKSFFKDKTNKRVAIFIALSVLLILFNASQVRYTLMIIPIILLVLTPMLTPRQFKIQLVIFLILSLLVINPYLLQIGYETNAKELSSFAENILNIQISRNFSEELFQDDLKSIEEDYPNQTFIVTPNPDDYQFLADLYWGNKISEFVSIQDYELYLAGTKVIMQKNVCTNSKIWNRRDICIGISLIKNSADNTDYSSIKYAISLNNSSLENFKLEKTYKFLSVYKKQ